MKKNLFLIALIVFILCGCEEKKVANIIPEGEYDFVEEVYEDGTKITRDDYEEEDIYTDGMIINIWQNNKATLGWITKNKSIKKLDLLVDDEYLIDKDDKESKVKYKYSNNQIELNYEDGRKEVYIKDYQKQLDEKYKEMIGHYEIISWIDKGSTNISVTDEMKKTIYLDILDNKKAELNGYYNNGVIYTINSKHFYPKYEMYSNMKLDYTYDNGKIVLTNIEQTRITFEIKPDAIP